MGTLIEGYSSPNRQGTLLATIQRHGASLLNCGARTIGEKSALAILPTVPKLDWTWPRCVDSRCNGTLQAMQRPVYLS